MSCTYTTCIFQRNLNEPECERVCELCHIKRYAKGQCLRESYWANCVSMMLEGLTIEVEQHTGNKPAACGLNCAGSFVSMEELFQSDEDHGIDDFKDTLCATDCSIAVFRTSELRSVMDRNPHISEILLKHCATESLPAKTEMLINLGFGDARTSVKYIIRYLRSKGIPYLTHEQLALICHRSRQTITTTIQELQRTDPDLFASP